MTVPRSTLVRDEGLRDDASLESLAALAPAFRTDCTVTAGNSSPLNDGASMVLLGAENGLDAEPLARITGRGSFGNDPDTFGITPVEAANRALARAGRSWVDVDLVELNEAFAAQFLLPAAVARPRPRESQRARRRDRDRHPLGVSGGRIIGHLAHELARRGGGVGVAAICIGVGQGLAVVIER